MIENTNATINLVRQFSGAPIGLKSDEDIRTIISSLTEQVREKYKINFTPLKTIEVSEGNHNIGYTVKKRFPLKILELKIENNIIDVDNIVLDWASGNINIQSNVSTNTNKFNVFPSQVNSVKLKYLNAWMDKDDFVIETTAATIKGTSVIISVDDNIGFNIDDWVFIEGMDRRAEAAKITGTGVNTITVDNLVQTHESGSIITRLKKSKLLTDYVVYESAVAVAISAIGSTYTIATGYTMEGVSVQVGVPWTHWKNNLDANIKQRDLLKRQIELKLLVVG